MVIGSFRKLLREKKRLEKELGLGAKNNVTKSARGRTEQGIRKDDKGKGELDSDWFLDEYSLYIRCRTSA